MSKRNIAYIKPQDPSFLAKLKAEIGYKEGPTVDTKRQKLCDENGGASDSGEEGVERPERDDEQPQIVVLQSGDLTKEQAELEQRRIAKEEAEAPADLNQRVIFKKKSKSIKVSDTKSTTSSDRRQKKANCTKLSFTEKDEEGDEDE